MGLKTVRQTSFIKTKRPFAEYTRFEDDARVRAATKRDFVAGIISAPKYKYPKLDKLINSEDNGEFILSKEEETQDAITDLEVHRQSGNLSPLECKLYVDFYEHRLKKIMLVEAASRMRHASSPRTQQAAKRKFMTLNQKLYGLMDEELFNKMMATERRRVENFTPKNNRAYAVKQSLEAYFIVHSYIGNEKPLLDPAIIHKLQKLITARSRKVLLSVPPTNDNVVYGVRQCQQILQAALNAGGLAAKGWIIRIDAAKSNPATNVDERVIYIPSDTRRTASQLRRLIIHEQEVHARRGQNGKDSGIPMLERGTIKYGNVEEGLGVLLECVLEGNLDNQSYFRARDRYLTAGVALGVDGNPKDGRATFGLMWRLLALRMSRNGVIDTADEQEAKTMAMLHTENAFRGTNFAMPGIIYTKLKIYYEGLIKNAEYFTTHSGNVAKALDQALQGKYNHVDPREARLVRQLVSNRRPQQL